MACIEAQIHIHPFYISPALESRNRRLHFSNLSSFERREQVRDHLNPVVYDLTTILLFFFFCIELLVFLFIFYKLGSYSSVILL